MQPIYNPSWSVPRETLKLTHTEVHIWCASLNQSSIQINKFLCTLSPEEQAKTNRFYSIKNKNQFIITHGLLRDILSRYLDLLPEQIRFFYSSCGKPYIANELSRNKFRFNISHSHEIVIYALAWRREVGIDIEYIRSNIAYKRIAQYFFSPEELAKLQSLPLEKQNEAFFYFWTRKEAYLKARGEGIFKRSSSVLVNTDTELIPKELSRWSILSLQPEPRYIGALVAEGENCQLKFWRWAPGFQKTL
ncbi:4'-phosphopantetheinyl transferase superfamily protein [Candidatus Aerophobetes bacterium]|nr:4'-phosphopantetheinyl transferase superfamily protein [Candidatus Aerophobetes bacterium]